MKISEILNEKVISVGLECTDKDDAINKMVDLASNSGLMTDINKVRECVIERERKSSECTHQTAQQDLKTYE